MLCSLVSLYSESPQLGIQKNKLYETSEYWCRDKLNFDLLEKGLGIVSPSHFVYDFSQKKMFHVMLY